MRVRLTSLVGAWSFLASSCLAGFAFAFLFPLSAQPPATEAQMKLWASIKKNLQGPNGKQYFDANLLNNTIPDKAGDVRTFRATVLSGKPSRKPSSFVLSLSDGKTPEATIELRDARENLTPLLKPLAPGTQIEFYGIPVLFTQDPFMLTFEVKAENGPGGANPLIVNPVKKK